MNQNYDGDAFLDFVLESELGAPSGYTDPARECPVCVRRSPSVVRRRKPSADRRARWSCLACGEGGDPADLLRHTVAAADYSDRLARLAELKQRFDATTPAPPGTPTTPAALPQELLAALMLSDVFSSPQGEYTPDTGHDFNADMRAFRRIVRTCREYGVDLAHLAAHDAAGVGAHDYAEALERRKVRAGVYLSEAEFSAKLKAGMRATLQRLKQRG